MTKIYSGIEDTNGNIPWIDDETGEQGAEIDGPRTLTLKYKRTVEQFQSVAADELATLEKLLT